MEEYLDEYDDVDFDGVDDDLEDANNGWKTEVVDHLRAIVDLLENNWINE